LLLIAQLAIILRMKSKHAKTLRAIFAKLTQASIAFADIEALILGQGGQVREGAGSRVSLQLGDFLKNAHRPHPGKEAKKYQVEEIRAWLEQQGVKP
jgi:hypothetical protein